MPSSSPSEVKFSESSDKVAQLKKDNEINNVQVIPILHEKYSISKKIITQEFTIEKRLVEGIATIKVPVKYEEIYVNGKRFGTSREEGGGGDDNTTPTWQSILSSIKGAITNKKEHEDHSTQEKTERNKIELKGEPISLARGIMEEILPLYAEEIIINKKMKQIAEAVITKRKITENMKITFQIKGENVIVKYPDTVEKNIINDDSSNRADYSVNQGTTTTAA
jgi:stress response protein YsnF